MTRYTRRETIALASVGLMSPLMVLLSGPANKLSAQAPSAQDWMNEWMADPSRRPKGGLHLTRFKEPIYILTRPISWQKDDGSMPPITVPKGFVTDLASIPRVFYSLLRPDGEYTFPAIIHDYLYWVQSLPREKADEVLKLAMDDFKIEAWKVMSIYNSVRLGGQSAWDGNKTLKANGEKRVLRKFPEDPRTSWEDWKKDPAVFE